MRGMLNSFFAPRYSLGGTAFLFCAFIFTWKFAETGSTEPAGLLRLYAFLAFVFSPWFLVTWFTRLRIRNDRVIWRTFPLPRVFSLKDITALKRLDDGEPDSIARLEIAYAKRGRPRRVVLTPYIFPQQDVRALLQAIREQRPELALPYFA